MWAAGLPGACSAHQDELGHHGHLHSMGGCRGPQSLCPSICAAAALHCSFMSHCGNRQSRTSLGLVPILTPALFAAGVSSQLVSAPHSAHLSPQHVVALGLLCLCQVLQPWVLRLLWSVHTQLQVQSGDQEPSMRATAAPNVQPGRTPSCLRRGSGAAFGALELPSYHTFPRATP